MLNISTLTVFINIYFAKQKKINNHTSQKFNYS